jgi:putative thioredoxin
VWATWCAPCKQLSPILEELAIEYAGRLLIAKVDADAEPSISQALQVQSIPSVFAVIKGQLIPLFQGAYPKDQVKQIFDKLLELAAEQGLGPAGPGVVKDLVEVEVEETADPRFDEAVDAVNAGDWDLAKKAYQGILDSEPGDLDAQGGLIMAGIFERTDGVEPPQGDSFDELLITADLAAAEGSWESALAAAIKAVQLSGGAERELARTRLVEYFALAGDDPSVPGARIALANALF